MTVVELRQRIISQLDQMKPEQLVFISNFLENFNQYSQSQTQRQGWSPQFFERTAGCWEGEPLVKGEPLEFQERDAFL